MQQFESLDESKIRDNLRKIEAEIRCYWQPKADLENITVERALDVFEEQISAARHGAEIGRVIGILFQQLWMRLKPNGSNAAIEAMAILLCNFECRE